MKGMQTITATWARGHFGEIMRQAVQNVIIAGVLKPRWFFEGLAHALRGDFQLVLAPQTVAEILRWTEKRQKHPKRVIEFFLVASRFENEHLLPASPLPWRGQHNSRLKNAADGKCPLNNPHPLLSPIRCCPPTLSQQRLKHRFRSKASRSQRRLNYSLD